MKLVLLIALLALTGCGTTPNYLSTAPGAPLPKGLSLCKSWDEVGRCKLWSPHGDECINPKGVDAQPPVVPCSSVKR